jgi:hypothetical protein
VSQEKKLFLLFKVKETAQLETQKSLKYLKEPGETTMDKQRRQTLSNPHTQTFQQFQNELRAEAPANLKPQVTSQPQKLQEPPVKGPEVKRSKASGAQ